MRAKDKVAMQGKWTLVLRDARTGRFVRRVTAHNVICSAGETKLAQFLNGEITSIAPIYGAVGTGGGTPRPADTALFSELARASATSQARSGTSVTFIFFFGTAQANGTITEAGLFLVASATPGSGMLLNHATLGSNPKTSSLTATLQVQITFA